MTRPKNVVILGSTGSIGVNALDVLSRLKVPYRVVGLAANRNADLMFQQVRRFRPEAVSMSDAAAAGRLKQLCTKLKQAPVLFNGGGMERLAGMEKADIVLCGVVGFEGLRSLVSAIKAGKTIGLANKEALIVAGDLITSLAKKHGARIIPVDSEHSAIFQCLQGQNHSEVSRLILTASGGPFYRYEKDVNSITVEQALKHPTWKMGAKITIDSATLMNKGLEAIEAHHLFQVPMEKISIVIHPQSIVHSLVEFEDGAMLGQLSHPDMRLPIQYAFTYPARRKTPLKRLNLEDVGHLDFAKPDFSRFPCLSLALEAGRKGGTAPVVLSSSNETAVRAFIDKRISFGQIAVVVKQSLTAHTHRKHPTLNDVIEMDRWSRDRAAKIIEKLERNK